MLFLVIESKIKIKSTENKNIKVIKNEETGADPVPVTQSGLVNKKYLGLEIRRITQCFSPFTYLSYLLLLL